MALVVMERLLVLCCCVSAFNEGFVGVHMEFVAGLKVLVLPRTLRC